MSRQQLTEAFAAALASADVAFGHGADNAADEAERLVVGTLKGRSLTEATRAELAAALRRRIEERVPVAYLVGEAWLGGVRFEAPPGVMIPRSPIASVLADEVRPWLARPPRRILDLCCGCGALGIIAAHVFATAQVVLADDDPQALASATRNAQASPRQVAGRLEVVDSDLFEAVQGRFDLLLCNPPYVPGAELEAAPDEFHHEPRHGLYGGLDGLDVWRRIVASLPDHLAADGVLLGEAGNQAASFDAAFPRLGAVWLDLASAEPQADGSSGVFVSAPGLRRMPGGLNAARTALR